MAHKLRKPHPSAAQMRSEVEAFVTRGMALDEACQLVGLPVGDFYRVTGSERIKYLPTPDEIAAACAVIRERGSDTRNVSAYWSAQQGTSD